MRECWLKPNRRPIIAAGVLFALIALGAVAAIYAFMLSQNWFGLFVTVALGGPALACVVFCYLAARTPRLAYENGELLVYSKSFTPRRVPIDVVEVLFLGSGPALPTTDTDDQQQEPTGPRAANVVVRLAEAASDWHHRELSAAVDKWENGYIVLSGTTCEPISHERLNVINRRLAEVRRGRRDAQLEEAKVTS